VPSVDRPNTRALRDAGFTLVEVLVVVIIAGVLATIVTLGLQGATERGTTTACTAEERAIVVAIEVYQAQHGRPPSDIEELVPSFLSEVPGPTTATRGGTYDPTDGRFDPAHC
jgi:prepilin-type N-terminal cleavage/methylation domain-containing protein